MIIAELSGRCRQSPIVLGEEGQSLGTKDTLSIRPLDTHDQTQPTFEMTPGCKPFTVNLSFKLKEEKINTEES